MWRTVLSLQAQQDLIEIIDWTGRKFGVAQARTYRAAIFAALRSLRGGPAILGVKRRDEILPGLLTFHIAKSGRPGRHYLVFRQDWKAPQTFSILRILYDQMDIARHVPPEE